MAGKPGSRSGPRQLLRRGRWHAALPLLFILAAGQGCYAYRETDLGRLTPGEQVRVQLVDKNGEEPVPEIGQALTQRTFEGRFRRLAGDSVIVAIWIGAAYAGTPFESTFQDVILQRADIARVENRQLSKSRTALVAAGVGIVIAALITKIGWDRVFSLGGGGQGPPSPPTTPFSFRFAR